MVLAQTGANTNQGEHKVRPYIINFKIFLSVFICLYLSLKINSPVCLSVFKSYEVIFPFDAA